MPKETTCYDNVKQVVVRGLLESELDWKENPELTEGRVTLEIRTHGAIPNAGVSPDMEGFTLTIQDTPRTDKVSSKRTARVTLSGSRHTVIMGLNPKINPDTGVANNQESPIYMRLRFGPGVEVKLTDYLGDGRNV